MLRKWMQNTINYLFIHQSNNHEISQENQHVGTCHWNFKCFFRTGKDR